MKMKTKRKLMVAAVALTLGLGISSATLAGSYMDAVNALSPTHYYRLNETTANTSSPTVVDLGSSPITGLHVGSYPPAQAGAAGPDLPDDHSNKALFDNDSGGVNIGDQSNYAAENMTVAFFFKQPGTANWDRMFTNNIAGGNGLIVVTPPDPYISPGNPDEGLRVGVDGNSGTACMILPRSIFQPLDNQWHHIVVVRNGDDRSNMKVVIDGIDYSDDLVTTVGTLTLSVDGSDAMIGLRSVATGGYTDGSIDEVAVWVGTALTVAQAQDLYWASQKIAVIETDGSTEVTEGGPSDSFIVQLNKEPTAEVRLIVDPNMNGGDIYLNSENPDTDITLTFTTENWDTPQTVTVTAYDDTVRGEGTEIADIAFRIDTSDPDFTGITLDELDVTVEDNDNPGVTLDVGDGVAVAEESETTDSYTVVLDTYITADVIITITDTSDPNQVEIAPETLTFTTTNWDTPQTVTVTAIDDAEQETNPHSTELQHTLASSDGIYDGLGVAPVTVSITENERGFLSYTEAVQKLNPTHYYRLDEAGGGTGTTAADTGTGTTINGTHDGSYPPGIIGVAGPRSDDGLPGLEEDNKAFYVRSISDPGEPAGRVHLGDGSNFAAENMTVTFWFNPNGQTGWGRFWSNNQSDNTFQVLEDNYRDGLFFATGTAVGTIKRLDDDYINYDQWNLITVVRNGDNRDDLEVVCNGVDRTSVLEDYDADYAGIDGSGQSWIGTRAPTQQHVPATLDEFAFWVGTALTVSQAQDLYTAAIYSPLVVSETTVEIAEGGATDSFTVVLDVEPIAEVKVKVEPNELPEDIILNGGAAGQSITLTFNAGNWDTPQTVTVTAYDDTLDEGQEVAKIKISSQSTDTNYSDKLAVPVFATITDDDLRAVTITETADSTVVKEEGTTTDSYTVVLTYQPAADVKIISTDDAEPDQVEVGPTILTFTSENWDSPQTVTVTAIDDVVIEDPNHSTTISGTIETTDPAYENIQVPPVTAYILENDCGAWGYRAEDYNRDCIVDLLDLAEFVSKWLYCTLPNDPACIDVR